MSGTTAAVTGASGFIGRDVVRALRERGDRVIACVRRPGDLERFEGMAGVEAVCADILDEGALRNALAGADQVYHFAALVHGDASQADLMRVNGEGTRLVWECAAASGVRKALYCSSASVYGLLNRGQQPITESAVPRAVEPYGTSKLAGETAAREAAARSGLPTVVIRPVAVFGPGENSAFGRDLRRAVFSKLIRAGGFENRSFNYIHVEDVAGAAVHLMGLETSAGETFNVLAGKPVRFEEAFEFYIRALRRSGRSLSWPMLAARVSKAALDVPALSSLMARAGRRFVFSVWQPGFDLVYSPAKLLETSFRPRWDSFEDVLVSCAGAPVRMQERI